MVNELMEHFKEQSVVNFISLLGESQYTARCLLRNKKCDCNLLNNRFLKKKSITMGNDIETSELL